MFGRLGLANFGLRNCKGVSNPIPGLKGILGFYMGKGLTNEEMSKNPVWKDKSGLGNDFQMKNFAWGGMSGVDGYNYNFKDSSKWGVSANQLKEHSSNKIVINNKFNVVQLSYIGTSIKITLKVSGLNENSSRLKVYDNVNSSKTQEYNSDGIYEINYIANEGATAIFFYVLGGNIGKLDVPIIIEQFSLYSGAIVFDGVNDYGICETFPVLTKEKGYTVMALRKYITDPIVKITSGLASKYVSPDYGAFCFEFTASGVLYTRNFGVLNTLSEYPDLVTWQTSKFYNGTSILIGDSLETESLFVGRYNSTYANVALYSLVVIDHDTTEEERQLVIDYWGKEFPELFID